MSTYTALGSSYEHSAPCTEVWRVHLYYTCSNRCIWKSRDG